MKYILRILQSALALFGLVALSVVVRAAEPPQLPDDVKVGEPHGDGFIGFRQMQWTHFRYRNVRVWEAADLPESEDPTSLSAIRRRRNNLIQRAAAQELRRNIHSGKQTHPIVLARLATGRADEECKHYLAYSASYRAKDSMFGMSSLSGIVCRFEAQLPEDVRQKIREQVLTYPHFLDGGTENHVTMKRAAGLLFGEQFPDERFQHGITGRELASLCKDYVRDYGQRVYASSLYEYLSPVYFGVHLRSWLHGYSGATAYGMWSRETSWSLP